MDNQVEGVIYSMKTMNTLHSALVPIDILYRLAISMFLQLTIVIDEGYSLTSRFLEILV